jgi:hypothetical protein
VGSNIVHDHIDTVIDDFTHNHAIDKQFSHDNHSIDKQLSYNDHEIHIHDLVPHHDD